MTAKLLISEIEPHGEFAREILTVGEYSQRYVTDEPK